MMAGVVEETIEQKLKRHEYALSACMVEIEKLRAENERLRSEKSDALSVCQLIYSDPDAPLAIRIKAAGLALPHETPKLQSVPPPLELTAEPIVPLAELVERQRARANQMQREAQNIQVLPSGQVLLLDEPDGNGNDNDH